MTLRFVAFESRRSREMAKLIESQGGTALVAPSLREVPLEENAAVIEFASGLMGGRFGLAIFLTGVGTRALFELIEQRYARADLVAALLRVPVAARGPKPVAVLREYGITPAITAPEPNTWRELLGELDRRRDTLPLARRRVALQEFGAPSPGLVAELQARGADVVTVPIYRWALPEDLGPLREAIHAIVEGRADVALFTNAMQVGHLFQVAGQEGLAGDLKAALQKTVVASIGPTATAALSEHGVPVAMEPSHPRMGLLVKEAAERAPALLAARRD